MARPGNCIIILSPSASGPVSPGKVTLKGTYRGKRPFYICGAVFQGNVVPDLVDTTRGKILPGKHWRIDFRAADGAVAGPNFAIIWALYRKDDPVERFGFFWAGYRKRRQYGLSPNTITLLDPNGNVNIVNHQVTADGDWNGAQPVTIEGMIWNTALGQPPMAPPMGTTPGNVNPGMGHGTWSIPNIPNVQCSHMGMMNALVVWATYPDGSHSMGGTGFSGFC
ncbi:MAG TPA: hypothetical protein VKE98_17485 [Gemmataceae bacterium]|nr:hypothetical protein [Gemmataceae bacterium]